MLFRRIAEHVKHQNWTAVGLDFVIVVVGVFFGMQVQSLYEEGARQNADKQYLERLHREVIELKEIRAELIEPRRKNLTALTQAAEIVFGDGEPRNLTTLECTSIHLSHIYASPTFDLPTVSELISAGRLDTLSSSSVREAIVHYTQGAARAENLLEAVSNGRLMLSREYPELIALDALDRGDLGLIVPTSSAECDVAGMRANQGFLNSFADNIDRSATYFGFSFDETSARLEALHTALDEELGLSREGA